MSSSSAPIVLNNTSSSNLYLNVYGPPTGNPAFTVGDTVQGVLRVRILPHEQEIILSFNGDAIVRVNEGGQIETMKVEMFKIYGESYDFDAYRQGYNTVRRREIPFEFRIPRDVEYTPPPEFKERDGFESGVCHTLPPTCRSINSFHCVEYYLEATSFIKSKATQDRVVRQSITFMPPTPEWLEEIGGFRIVPRPPAYGASAAERTGLVRIRSHKLIPESEKAGGLFGRVKDWAKEDRPCLSFIVGADVPQAAIPGRPLPIKFSLDYTEQPDPSGSVLDIYIRRIRIQLQSKIRMRVPFKPTRQDRFTSNTENYLIVECDYVSPGKLLFDGISVTEIIHSIRNTNIPTNLIPDFMSFSMHKTHVVEVKIWGECVGEKFESVSRSPIIICSGLTPPPLRWFETASGTGALDSNLEVPSDDGLGRTSSHGSRRSSLPGLIEEAGPPDEELPSYEEATRGSGRRP